MDLILNKLFPESANNDFRGYKIALWGFIAFTLLMTWRSIIHMLFEQYGFHEIANFTMIAGDPDPMILIYRFFSLWGFAQLIFCFVCWVVIFRYRALIPLMYLLWLFEWSFRTFGYPLIREDIAVQGIYTVGATPGAGWGSLYYFSFNNTFQSFTNTKKIIQRKKL
jgi:hypothetical protein